MNDRLRPCPHCHTPTVDPSGSPKSVFCRHCGGDLRATFRVTDVASALEFLRSLGAPPHLVRHHQLVAEAASELVAGLCSYNNFFRANDVLIGAALHDAGKILFPRELHGPGHRHEHAGKTALEAAGLGDFARFCVTHAQWDRDDLPGEDRLVALADKLWKGKRVIELEQRVIQWLAQVSGEPFWDVFTRMDTLFEQVANGGPARLQRSQEPPE